MIYDPNNIFARILRKEIPAKIVYEDDFALAFYDLYPKAPVHALVIPKGEYISFYDFSEKASPEFMKGFYKAVQKTIDILDVKDQGFRVLSNHGQNGGQEVPHFHLHILGGRLLGKLVQPA